MAPPLLVLASNSPRRRELLRLGGWAFESRTADVDESQYPGEAPGEYVLRLAASKARNCAASPLIMERMSAGETLTVLAADTTVVDGKAILGKPRDKDDAVNMLRRLRNRTHQVFTGIAAMRLPGGNLCMDLCVTNVPMRTYSDEEIEAYVATGDPLDKAGAYAIQHPKFHPVESLSGCYASVMGLPLCHLTRTLQKLNIAPLTDISTACQSSLNYICPISAAVLHGEQVG
jgi:septum formation protein